MKFPVTRKETYMGETPPNSQESAKHFAKSKIIEEEEDVHTILLLDTPRSTPVGSPEPEIPSSLIDVNAPPDLSQDDTCEVFKALQIQDSPEATVFHPSSAVKRSEPQEITPKNQRPRRRKKRASESFSDCFADNYRMMDDLLGEGACGSVTTCVDVVSGGEFAVKTVVKTSSRTREKIFREIDILHQCRKHPNVVQLMSFFEEDDKFLLVFEKGHGGTLLDHTRGRQEFTEYDASVIIRDLATALQFLHSKGIAHRDLKLDNILCHSMEEASPVKLCDFDLATGGKDPDGSAMLSPVGSAYYMAPEVIKTFVGLATHYDKRCDMWSLGVVMYILLCGYPPFNDRCDKESCRVNGASCSACEDALFQCIVAGKFNFPEEEWKYVSDAAKDLIENMLVKEVNCRFTAEMVLHHPWVSYGGPDTELVTPSVLRSHKSSGAIWRYAGVFQPYPDRKKRHTIHSSFAEEASSSPSLGLGNLFRFSPLSDSLLNRRYSGSPAGKKEEMYFPNN